MTIAEHVDPDELSEYLGFVGERHRVWERRHLGLPAPWSDHFVLRDYKFTNVYRVLDHGSQFLLRELLNEPRITPRDALARAFLYRMTNRPAIWEKTKEVYGSYPTASSMTAWLGDAWCGWRDAGLQAFSGAYVIMPRPGVVGDDKLRSVTELAAEYFNPEYASSAWVDDFIRNDDMAHRFNLLLSLKGVGKFLAMQILTDYGYSPFGAGQDENYFVIAGPGARAGARAIAPGVKAESMIQFCRDAVLSSDDCPLLDVEHDFGTTKRPPSMMDIQNTLCEFSKYVRYRQRGAKLKPYRAAHPEGNQEVVLPGHWY